MIEFATRFLRELYGVFLEASPYILLGFTVAAAIQILLPVRLIERFLGGGRMRSITAASFLGIPLPLCSCSVLPTALALRRRGAGRGATLSFLVSTPETGLDSIALTYGLMDPLMAIYRPFAALVSALTAGFAAEMLGEDLPAEGRLAHDHDRLAEEEAQEAEVRSLSLGQRLRRGFRGAFVEIFDETSHWMLAGLVISALIGVLLPAEIVTRYLSSGPLPLLLMLVIGIPLYICASASTPIAAALVLKGLSPGAALVFLLAGPATNIGSLAILARSLGRRVTAIYLATIAVLSVALGALLDVLYRGLNLDPGASAGEIKHLPVWFAGAAAVVFAGLLFFSFRRVAPPTEFRAIVRALERLLGFRLHRRLLGGAAGAALALWALSTCVLVVPPGHRGLVRRFGSPVGGPRGEGLHLKWPPPVETSRIVHTDRVRRIEIGFRSPGEGGTAPVRGDRTAPRRLEEESLYLTGDENLLATKSVVQYRVTDPERYIYGFDDAEATIKLETVSEILDVLAGLGVDGVYTDQRSLVESRVLDGMRERAVALGLGVEIQRFSIRDVHAPPEVHAAFRDVASSQEDKETAINVARRYYTETVNLARGEAVRELETARGYALGETHRARGGSRSLGLRSDAYQAHRTGTKKRLYLETMEEVLSKGRKIIRPGWQGAGNVDLWISGGSGTPVPVGEILKGSDVRESERARGGE